MNSFVPWGTVIPVQSGTRSACFRGPKSLEIFRSSTACRVRNFTNQLNLTGCCEPAGCGQLAWRNPSVRFQGLTNTPIRQCEFVFGDTCLHARVRVSTRSSSSPGLNVQRHTKLLRKARQGELANPESFEFLPIDLKRCGSGDRHQRPVRHHRISLLINLTAGRSNARVALDVSARRSSNEGAAA